MGVLFVNDPFRIAQNDKVESDSSSTIFIGTCVALMGAVCSAVVYILTR